MQISLFRYIDSWLQKGEYTLILGKPLSILFPVASANFNLSFLFYLMKFYNPMKGQIMRLTFSLLSSVHYIAGLCVSIIYGIS